MTEQNKYSTTPRDYNHVGAVPQSIATGKALGKVDPTSQTLARDIRNFAWAEDTQESIARFIEWCSILYNFTTDRNDYIDFSVGQMNTMFSDVIKELSKDQDYYSLPEISGARGGFDTLGARLEDTNAQLAQKVDKGNVSVSDINKNLGKLDQSYMSDELLQQMAGNTPINATPADDSLTTVKYADKSVTADKVSFLKTGINKFNGDYKHLALASDGSLLSQYDAMTAVIPVVGGKTYHFAQDGGNRRRLAWHSTKPKSEDIMDYYMGNMPWGAFNETAPVDATYLIYTVSSNEGLNDIQLQITEDESYPFFVGYDFLSINNVSQLENKFSELESLNSELESEINILKKTNVGILYGNNPILKIDYTTKKLTVPSGTRMFYNGMRTVINDTTLDFADNTSRTPMALVYVPETSNLKLHYIGFVNSLNDNEILLGIISYAKPEMVGINIDNCEINGEMFVQPQIKEEIDNRFALGRRSDEKFFLLDDITGVYEKPSGIVSVASGQPFDLVTSTSEDIYDIYDDLVTRYPNYVSRTLLGNEPTGKPIYQYVFTSPDIDNNSAYPYKKLKILLASAIHGYEQGSAWCLAQFFKDLCDNYSTKEQLEFMRWNVDFVVVPVANPYGYDNNQRTNSNTVDLNRNFPANWSLGENTGGVNGYYGGESAGSEIETQLLMSVIDAHTDAEWFIDYHNISSGYPLFYLYDSKASTIALNTFKTLTRKWKNDYSEAPQDEIMFGYIKTGVNACAAKYAIMEHSMKSFVFETPWAMPFGSAKYDKTTIETGIEALGNTLVTIFKSLK